MHGIVEQVYHLRACKKEPHYNLSIYKKRHHSILSNISISNAITYKLNINSNPKIKTWLLSRETKTHKLEGEVLWHSAWKLQRKWNIHAGNKSIVNHQ